MGLPEAILVAASLLSGAIVMAAWLLSRRREESRREPPRNNPRPSTPLDALAMMHQQFANLGIGPILEAPHSADGCPIEPSGIAVEEDTPLRVGGTVLSFSQGRWWRAEILGFERDGNVRLHYPGWDTKWDTTVPREELQIDLLGPDADRDERERMFEGGR